MLLDFLIECEDVTLKRKATLLLTEVLKKADSMLPSSQTINSHNLSTLFGDSINADLTGRSLSSDLIYQIDSVSRTLQRTGRPRSSSKKAAGADEVHNDVGIEQAKPKYSPMIDEATFRNLLLDTQVLNTVNYSKWKWDLIHRIIEGPLQNPKRLDEAMKGSKFIKRLIAFYRPFKYRYSTIRNSKPNQRYIRTACLLLRTMIQQPEGVKYLAENKMVRQIAECLAQVDRVRHFLLLP